MRGRKPNVETISSRLSATAGEIPDPPGFLNESALKEWHRIVPELAKHYALSPVDTANLAVYCSAYTQFVEIAERIESEGLTIRGVTGKLMTHPLLKQHNALMIELRRLAGEFGFTPASRGRIDPSQKPGDEAQRDEHNDLLKFNAAN
jgi:P27 family predicted phage terminase small subunit